MREQLRALEPLVPVFNSITDAVLWVAGDNDKAFALAEALPSNNGNRATDIARIYAAMRRYKEAAEAARNAPRELLAPGAVEAAAQLLRAAPAHAPQQEFPYLGPLSFVFAHVGLPERALEPAERNADASYRISNVTALVWQADYAAARKTERFKALVPEFCHPTTGDDFECN
jgi:thioredoxin-like negative regulator of GroEL